MREPWSPSDAVSARAVAAGVPAREGSREPTRDDSRRSGHRCEYDPQRRRRPFGERVDGLVRDVAAFRCVALQDLVARQFDGHPFAARKGLVMAERKGWVERRQAHGPKGGAFTVIVATPAGAARAEALWRDSGRPHQRTLSGAVKAAEVRHDVAVYRAACSEQARIEEAGGRVTRVRTDAELKSLVAARSEQARQAASREAADDARREAAETLGLPVEDGKVLVPDAQVEYVDAAGRAGRCNVEVVSEHYRGQAIRAKARAGFAMHASSARAASAMRRALGGRGGSRGGGRPRREPEVIEL